VDGVLTRMDAAYLILCARCLSAVWKSKVINVTDMSKVGVMLGKMGMTPSERSGVVVPKKKEENPFASYKKA
jgi:hypothetical protein